MWWGERKGLWWWGKRGGDDRGRWGRVGREKASDEKIGHGAPSDLFLLALQISNSHSPSSPSKSRSPRQQARRASPTSPKSLPARVRTYNCMNFYGFTELKITAGHWPWFVHLFANGQPYTCTHDYATIPLPECFCCFC